MSLDRFIASQGVAIKEGHLQPGTKNWIFLFQFLEKFPHISLIGEIGFNAGHSAELFLLAQPHTRVISFDLGGWPCVKWGKVYMDRFYPNRHTLILGNSLLTVPQFFRDNPTTRFDLIFIDGGHSYECAKADIENMRNMATPATLLIVDDLQYLGVAKAWCESLTQGLVTEVMRLHDPNHLNITMAIGHYLF